MGIIKSSAYKIGYQVKLKFKITLHSRDRFLLEQIKAYFGGVGKIYYDKRRKVCTYQVVSTKDLTDVIIPHFEKFPLLTKKRADFELFKSVIELMHKKEHLTSGGLQKIVSIKALMNKRLSPDLQTKHTGCNPVSRPVVLIPENFEPNWLAGFITGDGCFLIDIKKGQTKTGFIVTLKVCITQHSCDIELMKSLVTAFGCGRIESNAQGSIVNFVVTKFTCITEKILPLLEKYPIQGVKALDSADFCKVVYIMKVKGHLTTEGLEQIRKIKEGMNRKRSESPD